MPRATAAGERGNGSVPCTFLARVSSLVRCPVPRPPRVRKPGALPPPSSYRLVFPRAAISKSICLPRCRVLLRRSPFLSIWLVNVVPYFVGPGKDEAATGHFAQCEGEPAADNEDETRSEKHLPRGKWLILRRSRDLHLSRR